MCAPSAPAAPDYTKAAEATGASGLENTRLAASLNRPNVNTPLGSQTWTQNPGKVDQAGFDAAMARWNAAGAGSGGGTPAAAGGWGGLLALGQNTADSINGTGGGASRGAAPTIDQFTSRPDSYTQDITLSPEQQKLYDTNTATQQNMADIGNTQLQQAGAALSSPLDLNKVGGGQQEIQDALYRRATSMLDPQFQQQEASERDRLAQQGFQVGTTGYDKAIGNFDRSKAMAYGDARDRAIVGGQGARQQAIQEALLQRQTPLNEVNALRTGSQVSMPTFQATPGVTTPAATNYSGAAGQQGQYDLGTYNAQIAQQNAMLGGLTSIGAAYVGAPVKP